MVHNGAVTSCGAGDTYAIQPGDRFEVRAAAPVAYLCRFAGGTQP